MNTSSRAPNTQQEESPASVPQTAPPPSIGRGHPEYHFVEGLLKIEGSLGEIRASLTNLTKTVDSTKTKVDSLIEWKNKILGGAVVLGVICTLIGFGVSKFSSYVTIKAPDVSPAATAPDTANESQSQQLPPKSEKPVNNAKRSNH